MKKKELQSLPVLNATPKIMAAARQNHLQKETVTYGKWQTTYEFYEYGLFIRCAIKNDILMVALYLPEHLCTGGKLPSYTLFISRSERCFITYDYLVKKWRTATLYNLDLGTRFYYSKKKWISQSDIQKIQTYLGEEGGYEGVLRFQNKIREEELERRYRKETDRWDADLTQVPQLPKDWERWVSKVGIQENYIFYRYQKGGAKTGYCTYCGKEVPISKPKYNKEGRCPRCRHHVTYKTVNKAGRVSTKTVTMYLIQRCRDGFVTRMFEGERFYRPGEYDRPLISYREIGRVIYDQNTGTARPFYWGVYKQRNTRWIAGSVREVTSYYWTYPNRSYVGRVYGKTIPSLTKKELLKTGLLEYFRYSATFDLDEYLGALKRTPKIEQLVKVGLFRLADECINDITSSDIFKHLEQTSLTKTLGISRQQLKLLRLKNSEKDTLRWMQYETEIRRTIPDDIVAWFIEEKISPNDLQFIDDKMSVIQIYNYVRKQMNLSSMNSREILRTWADYLSMARGLRMDTNDPIIYRVNKLRQRHAELIQRSNDRNPLIEIGKVLQRYPHVDEICSSLADKYEYADDTYTIVAPKKIDDIFFESRTLHHCVSNSEYYWERLERRESYILFLRHTAMPDKPYYTLEVEPDGTVRQKRTEFDRQKPKDMEKIVPFLKKWQAVIAKRLLKKDYALADSSRDLRIRNLETLRKQKAKIHTGDFQGQLLADVLLGDLLENVYTIPQSVQKAA